MRNSNPFNYRVFSAVKLQQLNKILLGLPSLATQIKINLKKFFGIIFFTTGFFYILRFFYRNKLIVLTFHNPNHNEFEKQIKFIKKYYNPSTLNELYNYYYKNRRLPKYSLLLTFDDGYKNVKTFVEPILNKYGVKAIVFVPTGFINDKVFSWWDVIEYALVNTYNDHIVINDMNYKIDGKIIDNLIEKFSRIIKRGNENLKQRIVSEILEQTGVTLPNKVPEKYQFLRWKDIRNSSMDYGSHTVTHPILTYLNKKNIRKELFDSKKHLELNLGKPIISFCYPNGDYNELVLKEVKSSGYKIAFSTRFGFCDNNSNPLALKRISINQLDDVGVLSMKICGLFNILKISKIV